MAIIRRLFGDLYRDRRGLTTVEYAIVLTLIAVAGIGTWTTFGTEFSAKVDAQKDAIVGMGAEE